VIRRQGRPARGAVGVILAAAIAVALVAFAAAPARAWDPATTQAGLTERALLASSFHRVLARRLGLALGALEPLQLHSRVMPVPQRRALWNRLGALDPEGGYRPSNEGIATALAWVTAGAVLAETPPERGRNHFYDPRDGQGLDDAKGMSGVGHALRLALDRGGSVRGLATGTVFDLTGQPSLRWVHAPDNDQGLLTFHEHLAAAVSAPEPYERESALARALMALGGILAALEDVGEPAHVRNDFRAAFLQKVGPSGWDRASRFERYVADRHGRLGVPAPKQVVRRPTLEAFFSARDGAGLADRTQARFFSDGTVPEPVIIDANTTPKQVVLAARATLAYQRPTVSRLNLAEVGARKYVLVEGRRALAYERVPGRVRFFLDEAVYADAARALLPEVAGYAAGLTDHLLRGGFTFAAEGRRVRVTLEGVQGKAEGTLALFAEDGAGRRRPLAVDGTGGARSYDAGEVATVEVPEGTRRLAAVLKGKDGAGALVAVGEASVP
jgi:hypothetical protein